MNFIKSGVLLLIICAASNSILAQELPEHEPKYEKTVQDIGDYLQIAMPVAVGVTTLLIKDKKGTWQFAKGFALNLGITYALKYAINKQRDDNGGGHAFPSGHTSVAFQSASFVQKRYGWKYGIPSYILAGFVAYSRIDGYTDRHDGWDVLGGIISGVGSTYLFTTPYEKEHLELTFNSGNNSYLFGLRFKF